MNPYNNLKWERKPKYKRKFFFLFLIPLALLIKWLLSLSPEFTERYYARGFYKLIMQPVSLLTGLIPLSVAELFILVMVIYIPVRLIYLVVKAIRLHRWSVFFPFVANIVMIASLWFFVQTMVWNMNYERLSFADNANIEVRDSSVDELEALCKWLINNTNALRTQVAEDENGVMVVENGFKSVVKRSTLGYEEIEKRFAFLSGKYGPPKPVLLSRLMSHTNIIGIYSCLTGEANVDTDIPDMGWASTTLHEMAHQRGFAREDEANYIAYLACMAHPDVDFKYSGSVMALQYSMNALYGADPDRYFALVNSYSEGYLRDLKHEQAYWKQFQGVTQKVADKMNDTYLKLNGEADGVKSYGRMVDLLLAEYRSQTSLAK